MIRTRYGWTTRFYPGAMRLPSAPELEQGWADRMHPRVTDFPADAILEVAALAAANHWVSNYKVPDNRVAVTDAVVAVGQLSNWEYDNGIYIYNVEDGRYTIRLLPQDVPNVPKWSDYAPVWLLEWHLEGDTKSEWLERSSTPASLARTAASHYRDTHMAVTPVNV